MFLEWQMKGFVSRLNSKFSITVDVRCITCQGLYEAERGKMRTLIMQTKEKKKLFSFFSIGLNRDTYFIRVILLSFLPPSPFIVMPVSIYFSLKAIGAYRLLKLSHISSESWGWVTPRSFWDPSLLSIFGKICTSSVVQCQNVILHIAIKVGENITWIKQIVEKNEDLN